MGVDDLFHGQRLLIQQTQNGPRIVARIDHHSPTSSAAA
jgi:nanoRNase/pAp phosphatase (c-di-AMP/oligoRNAs hydrolase)